MGPNGMVSPYPFNSHKYILHTYFFPLPKKGREFECLLGLDLTDNPKPAPVLIYNMLVCMGLKYDMACANNQDCGQLYITAKVHVCVSFLFYRCTLSLPNLKKNPSSQKREKKKRLLLNRSCFVHHSKQGTNTAA